MLSNNDIMKRFSPLRLIRYIKAHKKELFWVWIFYQSVKGITTLTLIWIPLWLVWRSSGGA
jgi:late competence protein required for DNA uptake (superfamily II DNA/RNA helicase)